MISRMSDIKHITNKRGISDQTTIVDIIKKMLKILKILTTTFEETQITTKVISNKMIDLKPINIIMSKDICLSTMRNLNKIYIKTKDRIGNRL
jgi:hypothetical protein